MFMTQLSCAMMSALGARVSSAFGEVLPAPQAPFSVYPVTVWLLMVLALFSF